MNNYVLLYRFAHSDVKQAFENGLVNTYPEHQTETTANIQYFAFADREQPGVEDKLNGIIQHVQYTHGEQNIGDEDYVALYFAKKGDTDVIKRSMLLGPDSLVEADENTIPDTTHVDNLTNLLQHDFLRNRPATG